MIDLQLRRVFDHSEPFLLRNEVDQGFREGGLAGIGPAGDQNRLTLNHGIGELSCQSAESAPASTSCCMVNQCGRNFRIVNVTPFSEHGGNAAATREPSGRRASSSGFASPMSFPSDRAIRLTAFIRYFGSITASTRDRRPFRCAKIAAVAVDHDLGNIGIEHDVFDRLQEGKDGFE